MTDPGRRVPGSTRGWHSYHPLFLKGCLIVIIGVCAAMTVTILVVWRSHLG